MVGGMNTLIALLAAASMMTGSPFTLTSSGFQNRTVLSTTYEFDGMSCTGHDVSPPLHWSGVPAERRALR